MGGCLGNGYGESRRVELTRQSERESGNQAMHNGHCWSFMVLVMLGPSNATCHLGHFGIRRTAEIDVLKFLRVSLLQNHDIGTLVITRQLHAKTSRSYIKSPSSPPIQRKRNFLFAPLQPTPLNLHLITYPINPTSSPSPPWWPRPRPSSHKPSSYA